jgi:hypothetical protein
VDPESGLGWQPALWLSEQPPLLRLITTDLTTTTAMDPGTITDLHHMLITEVRRITDRDIIGGDRLLIGDDQRPGLLRAFRFTSTCVSAAVLLACFRMFSWQPIILKAIDKATGSRVSIR